CQQYDNWNPTF
nr:immunoglobulin light chain junction region [Macaca mulatta]